MMDTNLKRSTTFHPQIDEKREVVNCVMVHLLRDYCGKHPKLWDEHIPYVQHSYNQAVHLSMYVHHLRHVLATYQKILLIWFLEGNMTLVDMMTGKKHSSSFNGSS